MKRVYISLVIAVTLLLVACSPNQTPTPTFQPVVTLLPTLSPTPQPQDTPTPAPVPPTATPEPEKSIIVALQNNPDNLHPFYAQSPAAQTVLGALYMGCVGPNENSQPMALGCEQVPTLDNGGAKFVGEGLDRYLEVTFKIRLGWRWTDGQAVTANDAVFAWQLLMQPEANLRDPLTQKVFAMSAPDPRTIVVTFMSAAQARAAANGELTGDVAFQYFSQLGDYAQYAQQEAPLVDANYWGVVRWLPSHLLQGIAPKDQAASPFAQIPVGDGAFEIKSRPNTGIVLARSAQPFPLGEVKPTGIAFVFGDDLSAMSNYNISWVMPYDAHTALPQTVVVVEYAAASTEQILLNVDRYPFDDVKVRQALAHTINREALWAEVQLVVPLSPLTPTLGYVPQRALELLTEAGWNCTRKPCQKFDETKGVTQTLEFTLVTTERSPRNLVAQVIQKQLAEIGFGVNIQIVYGLGSQSKLFAPANAGGILLSRNFDAALYQAPETSSLRGRFDCASVPTKQANDVSKGNASGFCDVDIDQQILASEISEAVLTPTSRAKAYAEALAAMETQAPVVRLYTPKLFVLANGVSGLKPGANVPVTWNAWEWVLVNRN